MMVLEIINELIFYVCIFVLPVFTEMMQHASDRFNLGWILVGLLALLLLVNLGVLVFKLISNARRNCKRKKAEKEQKEKEEKVTKV